MPSQITAYDLLVSCPSDVTSMLPIIINTIDNFNQLYGRDNNLVIRPIHWSKNSFAQMGGKPQDLLNKQIVDSSDFVLGVFWTKFGSPTTNYGSGTEEEIERMIQQGKQVFLYFLDKPINPSLIDFDQMKRITDFKKRHQNKGIYSEISDETSLSNTLYKDISLFIQSLLHAADFRKRSGRKEVLWVDDHPENNVFERKTLEQYGIEFTLALNTKQALQELRTHHFCLVITDMMRNEGPREGYVLLDLIRRTDQITPVIIYAGGSRPEFLAETLQHGGQGNTNDPLELVDLVIEYLQ